MLILFQHQKKRNPPFTSCNVQVYSGRNPVQRGSYVLVKTAKCFLLSCWLNSPSWPAPQLCLHAVDGQNPAPLGISENQLFDDIYRGIIIPGFLRWCEMDFVHPQWVSCWLVKKQRYSHDQSQKGGRQLGVRVSRSLQLGERAQNGNRDAGPARGCCYRTTARSLPV